MFSTLQTRSWADHIDLVTLHRPESLNAINTQMAEDLTAFFRDFDHTRNPDVRVVVLTGSGDRAFSAGADLKERRTMDEKKWRDNHVIFESLERAMSAFPLPLIAAVNGIAFGGGCELAMLCDFIIAAEAAAFAQPEVKLGIIPGLGGTQRLPRRIGIGRAKELLFSGRPLSASEAQHWGLANRVVPSKNLLEETLVLAKAIAANAPIAVRLAKNAVDQGMDQPLEEALGTEINAYNATIPTSDRQEGILAFNEKRPPRFQNS